MLGFLGGVGSGGTAGSPVSGGYDFSTTANAETGDVNPTTDVVVKGGGSRLGPDIVLNPVVAADRVGMTNASYVNAPLAAIGQSALTSWGLVGFVLVAILVLAFRR